MINKSQTSEAIYPHSALPVLFKSLLTLVDLGVYTHSAFSLFHLLHVLVIANSNDVQVFFSVLYSAGYLLDDKGLPGHIYRQII